ncbi:TPA: Holliday junction resolvase RecU [Streptococcus suis]
MIQYPSGSKPRLLKVKSPLKDKQKTQSTVNYGSRGMSLEDKVNQTNTYYLTHQLAVIHKKPTPIQVVKVDYPKRSAAKIVEAYYKNASTTDYNGVYQGYYIDFEAKQTNNKTAFPLANLPIHQREHMMACIEQGGIAFLLLAFVRLDETYLVPYERIHQYINKAEKQSIPYSVIKESGYLCKSGVFPLLDYLAALDTYLEQRDDS